LCKLYVELLINFLFFLFQVSGDDDDEEEEIGMGGKIEDSGSDGEGEVEDAAEKIKKVDLDVSLK
jgi:hypothetical protein